MQSRNKIKLVWEQDHLPNSSLQSNNSKIKTSQQYAGGSPQHHHHHGVLIHHPSPWYTNIPRPCHPPALECSPTSALTTETEQLVDNKMKNYLNLIIGYLFIGIADFLPISIRISTGQTDTYTTT